MRSLVGNLPELLLHDIMSPSRHVVLIEDATRSARYVQVLADKEGKLFVECVSNVWLDDEEDHLSLDDELRLLELGFQPPEGIDSSRPNWWWYPDEDGLALEACTKMVTVLCEIFAVRPHHHVWVRQYT